MRRVFFTILSVAAVAALPAAAIGQNHIGNVDGNSGVIAQVAPVKQEPLQPGSGSGMTIGDCLGVLAGLNALDAGERRIVQAGKPTESAETIRFKLLGKANDAVTHNIFMLGQVQQEAQVANRRIQNEVGKGETIKPGTRENLEFDTRMSEYTGRPCRVELDHIRETDLDLEKNAIPASIRALLWKITDR